MAFKVCTLQNIVLQFADQSSGTLVATFNQTLRHDDPINVIVSTARFYPTVSIEWLLDQDVLILLTRLAGLCGCERGRERL